MMTSTNQTLVVASGYSTADQPGLQAFLFDEVTGELRANGSFAGINTPSFLVVHPNKHWVYVVSETGKSSHGVLGEVWALQIEREPFLIKAINRQTSRGDWPCHLQIDGTGRWLITTNYGSGNAAIYPLLSDGALGEMTDFVEHHGSGPNAARQEVRMRTLPFLHRTIALPSSPTWEWINSPFMSSVQRQANSHRTPWWKSHPVPDPVTLPPSKWQVDLRGQ